MGMRIEEAITRYKNNAEYERTHGNLQGCLEFKQLAKWLEELREYRNMYHADNVDNCLRENVVDNEMSIDDSERHLRLMLGGMKYAVEYWKDRDKEGSDIEQTNVEAVTTALETMRKYQKIEFILNWREYDADPNYHTNEDIIDEIKKVLEDGNDE